MHIFKQGVRIEVSTKLGTGQGSQEAQPIMEGPLEKGPLSKGAALNNKKKLLFVAKRNKMFFKRG